jgi:peptidoglycan-N-acetylglucosamine deacetylase
MTKRAVLVRYAALTAAAVIVAAALDVTVARMGVGWLPWLIDVVGVSALIVLTVGCFAHNAPLFGRVVDGVGVHDDVVALTFDDGPSQETTPRVLDALRSADARATFFVLGKHAERHPELVERMVREGHEVASHGYSHGLLVFASPGEITDELLRTQRLLEEAGAPPVRLFRAPHGFRNPFVVRVCRRLGYRVVGWTKGVFDTRLPGADVIAQRSVDALRPGAILLLHDADGSGDGDRSQTADALPAILEGVRERGLHAVTMSELAAMAPTRSTSWKRLGLVIGGVALVVTVIFERTDRQQVIGAWEVFKTLSVPLVIGALIANFVSVWFKAVVWKSSLDTIPGHPRFRYRQVIPALFIGFLLNTILVARLGEVGRLYVLRRRVAKDSGVTISMSTLAGTLVMEQIVLGITLVTIILGMTLLLPSVPQELFRGVIALIAAVVALILAVVTVELLARWRRRRRPDPLAVDPTARTLDVILRGAEAIAREMSRGQQLVRDPVRAARSLAGGLLSWSAQVLGIWLTLKAFGMDSNALGAAAVVFLASNVIGLVQITPGNVGVFQFAVVLALTATYGVDQPTAVAFAIGLQAIEVALGAGLGFVFLSLEGLSLGEVRRSASSATVRQDEELTPPPLADASATRRLVA